MKSAKEYVAAVLPEGGHGSQTLIFAAEAERAVEAALADAERYKDLLMRAVRNHTNPTSHEESRKLDIAA